MPESTQQVHGLNDTVTIRRDAFGVAHVDARNEADAWFGQGFAAAQDRLWQMEYDRRRATGRWAEAAGPAGLAADRMARRVGLEAAARADIEAMSPETLAMFEAYAAGVNAYLASNPELPPEYALTGITPEKWDAWESVAVFKIRHILMGQWQVKVALGRLLTFVGPDVWRSLSVLPPLGTSVILPPGGTVNQLFAMAEADITAASEHLGFLSEIEAGSNSWAVHGSRTTTGKPVICNDSHRALDVPNAYWNVHVRCPEFNVAGATFAGFPGFQHFGFNGSVAWNITHTQADYQDLYIERFDGVEGERFLTQNGWEPSDRRAETIFVRGGAPVTIECWRTRHGPVVHGDPTQGWGLALRYTATEHHGKPAFEAIRPMTRAGTVDQLFDAQRTWVDPVNNLVAADASGNIGYLTRGEVPIRSLDSGRLIPVPGWTGEHQWLHPVPFERLPRSVNPSGGYIATANQRVIDGDDPYISEIYAGPARADRLNELLGGGTKLSPETIASFQTDRVSLPARRLGEFLARVGPFTGSVEQARVMLANFDGNLLPERAEPLLFAYLRRHLAKEIFAPVIGAEAWTWATTQTTNAGPGRALGLMLGNALAALARGEPAPGGRDWAPLAERALAGAWADAVAKAGADPAAWRWGDHHGTGSKHPLSAEFPGAKLDPPSVPFGGDADTIQNAGYGWSGQNDFALNSTSIYRQVVDFADVGGASYIIPGGASGDPRSPHFADQLPLWQHHKRIPMGRDNS